MRIKRITVKKYKNLVDFDCEFSESNISAFIGNNGAGKSNILELITRAFSNAMNWSCGKLLPFFSVDEEPSTVDCTIEYELNGEIFQLWYNVGILNAMNDSRKEDDNKPTMGSECVAIIRNDKVLKRSEYKNALPSSILLYYAGETNRQKINAEDTYDSVYDSKLKKQDSNELPGLRFLDYYCIDDLPLLLLVLSSYQDVGFEKVLELFNCKAITPKFSLVIGDPEEEKKSRKRTIENYWGSTGFVNSFLDELRRYVSATRDAGNKYFMFFEDAEFLKKISSNEFELFSKLKALKNYGILKHIGIELENKTEKKFSQLRLSEGEKQLALIYLLTSFTSKNDCLYLFDEFDSYLHLNWQRSISEMLRNINVDGHIIFTTHSPGTISQIKKDNLYIMRNGQVVYPTSETFNRALDEIMLEQMDVSMLPPEVEDLYDKFKQSVAERKKEQAEHWMKQLEQILDENNPLFIKMRINLRRI